MTQSTKFFRVRFCEWQTFAINIPATSRHDAIAVAQAVRDTRGTIPFEEITGGSDDWKAEELHPCEPALPVLKKALDALKTAPLDQATGTGHTAGELEHLIREIEGGVA